MSTELEPTAVITPAEQAERKAEALRRGQKFRTCLNDSIQVLQAVEQHRDWEALGLADFEAWWADQVTGHGFKMTTAQVRKIAPALAEIGLSQRQIASATGADRRTVREAVTGKKRSDEKPTNSRPDEEGLVENPPVPTNPVDNRAVTPEPVQPDMTKTQPADVRYQLLQEQLSEANATIRKLTAERDQARLEPARLRKELETERARPSACMYLDEPWHKAGVEHELGEISRQHRHPYPGAPPSVLTVGSYDPDSDDDYARHGLS